MSNSNRRDRNALIAFIAILFSIIFVCWISQPASNFVRTDEQHDKNKYAKQNISEAISSKGEFNFWQDTFPNWLMGIFSVITAGISWRAVVYVRDTLVVSQAAVKAANESVIEARKGTKFSEQSVALARDALFATDRAWIELKCEATSDLIFEEDNIHLSIKYTYRNIGNSPAINLRIEPPEMYTDAVAAQERLNYLVKFFKQNHIIDIFTNGGFPIFPGQSEEIVGYVALDTGDFTARITELDEIETDNQVGKGTLSPAILIFAIYRLPSDKKNRITAIIFNINWTGLDRVGFDDRPKLVTMNMLKIKPAGFGSFLS
ncbi:hypothetical protein ACQZ4Q_14650 [Agrobacterium vitis]